MTDLVEHARHELQLLGEFDSDPAYAQSIVAAVAAFASYGHSGGSAMCAIQALASLLRFEAISPLTDDPEEWQLVSDSSDGMWQSRRDAGAFSTDGGKTYYHLDHEPRRDTPAPTRSSGLSDTETKVGSDTIPTC